VIVFKLDLSLNSLLEEGFFAATSEGLEHCHDGLWLNSVVAGVVVAGVTPEVPTGVSVDGVVFDLGEQDDHVAAPLEIAGVFGISIVELEATLVAAMK